MKHEGERIQNNTETRKITFDDKESAHEIWANSFGFRATKEGANSEIIDNTFGTFNNDNKLSACADFIISAYKFGKHIIKIAEIYRVATALTERNKGYARKMIIDTLSCQEFAQCVFAWLKPTDSIIYENMGFTHALLLNKMTLQTSQLKKSSNSIRIIELDKPDMIPESKIVEELKSVYEDFCLDYDIAKLRNESEWRNLMQFATSQSTNRIIGFQNDCGIIGGYLVFGVDRKDEKLLNVYEFFWREGAFLNSMFHFMQSLAKQFDKISLCLPDSFPIDYYVCDLVKIEIHRKSQGMFKIVNVTKALYLLKPPSSGDKAEVYIDDPNSVDNTGLYSVEWSNNMVCSVTKLNIERSKYFNRCSVDVLTKLLLIGYSKEVFKISERSVTTLEERMATCFQASKSFKIGNS